MKDCGLTRGAFYAHFDSKADLYRESLMFAVSSTKLAELKPDGTTDKEWLCILLDGYLSLEHVRGEYPCPIAFLATDIAMHDDKTKAAYASVYEGMNKAIFKYANSYADCDESDILSVTSMLIGARLEAGWNITRHWFGSATIHAIRIRDCSRLACMSGIGRELR